MVCRGVTLPFREVLQSLRCFTRARPTAWRLISTTDSSSKDSALSFCVVGTGPAGFYTAEKLMKRFGARATVDLLDRLPTPFGLVRSGVAPDHQDTKNVIRQFTASAHDTRCTFYGNVHVGRDVSVAELQQRYHAVVLACGTESDRRLGIPGEDAQGVMSAREFVWWYNAHPDAANIKMDLSKVHSVAICGVGNVALDCSRVLLKDAAQLASTDMATHALKHLSEHSAVREVHLVARRGPAQAAFTPKELKELLTQSDISTFAGPHQMDTSPADKVEMAAVRMKRRLLDIMSTAVAGSASKSAAAGAAATEATAAVSASSSTNHTSTPRSDSVSPPQPGVDHTMEVFNFTSSTSPLPKKIHLQFYRSPVEMLTQPSAEDPRIQQVTGLKVEKTALVGTPAVAQGTGEFETIPAQLVLVSIGYTGLALPGVPFDKRRGVIPNQAGRVMSNTAQGSNDTEEGLYVVGWLKRGPSGIIGTNLIDAEETVACIIADLPSLEGDLQRRISFAQGGVSKGSEPAVASSSVSCSQSSIHASSNDLDAGARSVDGNFAADKNGDDCVSTDQQHSVVREGSVSSLASLQSLLRSRGVQFVSFSDWSKLDEFELQAGKQLGKVRDKMSDHGRMVELCLS